MCERNADMIPPAVVTALLVAAKAAGKAVGQAVLSLLASLLAGKTLRVLLYKPLAWLSRKTRSKVDDVVVEAVREDWQLPPEILVDARHDKLHTDLPGTRTVKRSEPDAP